MALTLAESHTLNDMAGLLYDFLPGSGNSNYSYPIAAAQADVSPFWVGGSKRPAILTLIQETFDKRRSNFCKLILCVVRLSMSWRSGKGNPLTIEEIDQLNALLLKLSFKIPDLHEPGFRQGLARKTGTANSTPPAMEPGVYAKRYEELAASLEQLMKMGPQPRGFAFERFLDELFAVFNLSPRKSFRLVGEQIDGSFHLNSDTYLVEAKWQDPQIGNRELQAFAGSVRTKAIWSRGLFISYSGFSEEGLVAFGRGDATRIICLEGLELWQVLNQKLNLVEVLSLKTRRAAETGRAHVPVRELCNI
jgi:restriction endonuclease Mrr